LKPDGGESESKPEAPSRVRAFFALPVPDDALEALRRAREALRRGAERSRVTARFLPDEALHVTLCFLGSVTCDRVTDFVRALEACVPGAPIDASLSELGAFSSPKRARVVVAELTDPEGRITELARRISEAAEALGVSLENRAFQPHVTLARIRRPSDVRSWLAHATLDRVALRFDELRLYESELHPQGSRYSVLGRAQFGPHGALRVGRRPPPCLRKTET
jgi:2'-5' RNA ligase